MPIASDDLIRKVTIRISDDLFKKLGHYCVDEDKSVNQVITELLEKLLSEGKKPKR
jgi:predicted CopG family antitoxin